MSERGRKILSFGCWQNQLWNGVLSRRQDIGPSEMTLTGSASLLDIPRAVSGSLQIPSQTHRSRQTRSLFPFSVTVSQLSREVGRSGSLCPVLSLL